MEEIRKIKLEMIKLEKEIKEKRKEIIKAKLKEAELNGISYETQFTEEEYDMLRNFVYGKEEYRQSVLIQSETVQTQLGWEYGINYDKIEEECFLRIGDKILSLNNYFIDKNNIREESQDGFGYY